MEKPSPAAMRVLVGHITGAHGIRGEVKIKSLTDQPLAIAGYGPLLASSGAVLEIVRARPAKGDLICTLKTVTDRNGAEALKGVQLFAARENMPQEMLLADLVGKRVTHAGTIVGTIAGFQNFGAGDLMEFDNGVLVPLRFLDIGRLDLDLPAGFLDSK